MTVRLGVLGKRFSHVDWFLNELDGIDVELVGIAEPDDAARAELGRWGAPAVATYEELLDAGLDLGLVSAVNDEKADVIELAAGRGVHLVVDKPLLTTEEQLDRVARAVEDAGVHCSMLMTERYTARYRELKRALDAGELGRVASYVAVRPYAYIDGLPDWLRDPERSGGPFVDLMIHDFDLVRWFHAASVVEVVAHHHTVKYADWPGFRDSASALLRFADGATAQLTTNWLVPRAGGMFAELSVFGSDGNAWLPSSHLALLPPVPGEPEYARHDAVALVTDDGVRWIEEVGGHMHALAGDVVAAAAGERAPAITAADTFATMRLALAARRSAKLGRPVKLDASPVPH